MDTHIIQLEKKNIKLIDGKLYLSSYLLNNLTWNINSFINIKVFARLILLEKIEKSYCAICNNKLDINESVICPHCNEILIDNKLLNLNPDFVVQIYGTKITQNKTMYKHFFNAINYKYTLKIPKYILNVLDLSGKEYFNFYYMNSTIIIGG